MENVSQSKAKRLFRKTAWGAFKSEKLSFKNWNAHSTSLLSQKCV